MRLAFISWNCESKFFRLQILMEAGDTRAADSVDTVHHEIDKIYVVGEQEKDPAGQSK